MLIVDVVFLLGLLHCVVAGDVADISQVRAGGGVSVCVALKYRKHYPQPHDVTTKEQK